MVDTLTTTPNRSVWHLLAGVLMIGLGIYIWFNPMDSLLALALYLGVVFIILGGGYIMSSFTYESGWYMFLGILDILVGVIFVANLGLTAVSLPIIFAFWCLVVGAVQLVSSYQYRHTKLMWSLLISGIIGVVFGYLILMYPALGTITITALMGAYVVLYGIVEIMGYNYSRKVPVAA